MVAHRRQQDDGSFQIAVPPGKGHLLVFGPTPDYILEEIGMRELWHGRPGGRRYYAHDIVAYGVKPGEPPRELVAAAPPGKTRQGAAWSARTARRSSRPRCSPGSKPKIPPDVEGNALTPRPRRPIRAAGLDPERSVPVIFSTPITSRGAPSSSPASRPARN